MPFAAIGDIYLERCTDVVKMLMKKNYIIDLWFSSKYIRVILTYLVSLYNIF